MPQKFIIRADKSLPTEIKLTFHFPTRKSDIFKKHRSNYLFLLPHKEYILVFKFARLVFLSAYTCMYWNIFQI